MVDGLKPERDDDAGVTALDVASGFRGVQTDRLFALLTLRVGQTSSQ